MQRYSLFLIVFFAVLNLYIIDATINDVPEDEWWHNSFIYELYIQSFKDSNGDGLGDLNGATSKLEHIKDLGISTVWITPFYKSPMIDFGYDITDFKGIDPLFGNFNDFDRLIQKANSLDMKIVLDFVPNHTSDQHPWFVKSVKRIKPYDDYYIWFDGKIVNGTRQPPTNWLSIFHISAWTWNEQRQQYYYHGFTKSQPDLNFRNPRVNNEMKKILRFWLKKGIKGFRVDTIPSLVEGNPDEEFPLKDQPKRINSPFPDGHYLSQVRPYSYDPTGSYPIFKTWRDVLDGYSKQKKLLLAEAYFQPEKLNYTMNYYNYGADVPMNVFLIGIYENKTSISGLLNLIEPYLEAIPKGKSPNWVFDNHDRSRAATRFGRDRADQMTMFTAVLPGIVVVYQGGEIGMEDRPTTWEETIDPPGCNLGPDEYHIGSRDPNRSPFQWDNTTSAGFSKNNKTWLPVHENYKTLNLAAQKLAQNSHYHIFKKAVALKKIRAIREGKIKFINVNEKVLIVIRCPDENLENIESLDRDDLIVLLINFTDGPIDVNLADYLHVKKFNMMVYVASLTSHIKAGSRIKTDNIYLPPAASVILRQI
ncbi:alpha-glucosidase-like [Aphidius gifuensis]|uniref:alpha-glucosidase-like n=1 Tax=Aphidius gifuensis TaxID=684658 RepID=UPI001CDD8FB1|nr:alpha-glucosidase-like [Aphidius gifuensis]